MFTPFLDIGVVDILDITFVAVLLYTALVWVKRTRAAFVVRGLFILGAIYIVARQLEFQLTAWIFQGFFAIFLIIIVVIFQEELRQIFERIAVWSLPAKATPALRSAASNILVRTLADLVKERTGALIVLRGQDPLERHIEGGIELGGKLSEPLLKSIFDPHSPGHDGAVLVEEGLVSRFAVQLPLSRDFEQLSQVGTRHSAALGLAELTDALCIVASEERGKISVARDGRLRLIDNPQELGAIIEDFLHDKYPSRDHKKISIQLLRENRAAKVGVFFVAAVLWYVFVAGSKMVETTYKIPVELENLPQDFRLETIQPTEISVIFMGPRRAFYFFDPKKLKVTVDLSLAELGRRSFPLSGENVTYPKNLTLQELSPSSLKISVKKLPQANKDGKEAGGVRPKTGG